MNPEFEKLFEAAFTDGYITPKELEVLKKKGESLGIAAGEIDIMIDSKLYEINNANKSKLKKEKCLACGEKIKPHYINCPSCGSVLDENRNQSEKNAKKGTDSYDAYAELEDIIFKLQFDKEIKPYNNTFFWVYTILTLGIYALVKKIVVGGNVLDGNEQRHASYTIITDFYSEMYAIESADTSKISQLIEKRDELIKKNVKKNILMSVLYAFIIFLVIWGGINIVVLFNNNSVKNLNTEHFKEDDFLESDGLDDEEREEKLSALLITLDSLRKAGDTTTRDYLITSLNNKKNISWLIDRETRNLIEHRKFKEAIAYTEKMKEHSGLLSFFQISFLHNLPVADSITTTSAKQIYKTN